MADWQAIVLAAGRGPDDPMAKAYGVSHKCSLPVGGVPMLARVVAALRATPGIGRIAVVIENEAILKSILGADATKVAFIPAARSAPASALAALDRDATLPALITTGDHALLTTEMVSHVLAEAGRSGADFTAALATAEVISKAYPETRRTYFRLGPDRVSGCNLFTVRTASGRRVLEIWQDLEQLRKKPWKLVAAFGLGPLLLFLSGRLNLKRAFAMMSNRLGCTLAPIMMPQAEAAIDVDKPSDKDLAEQILARRGMQLDHGLF
jgi:GTP:adenosylcobinamide-phosphate guanylyltransferase